MNTVEWLTAEVAKRHGPWIDEKGKEHKQLYIPIVIMPRPAAELLALIANKDTIAPSIQRHE